MHFMDFTRFDAEYGAVLNRGMSMQRADFAVEVERLHGLADQVEPAASQEKAHGLVAKLDKVLANRPEPVSEAVTAAVRAHRRARNAQGGLQERITSIRAGIAEIGAIADTAPPKEQSGIRQLAESLSMLAESLEISASSADE